MRTVEERLNSIFGNTDFLNENSDSSSVEELYSAVAKIEPNISKGDVEKYLIEVSRNMNVNEFSEDYLDNVYGGGVSILATCATIVAIGKAMSVLYKGGKEIGKGIYYLTHR